MTVTDVTPAPPDVDVVDMTWPPPELTLHTPLEQILNSKDAKALAKHVKASTVGELLWHLPRRYARRGDLVDLTSLIPGEHATIIAEVKSLTRRPMRGGRNMLVVELTDGTRSVQASFFGQAWRSRELLKGTRGLFAGKVGEYNGRPQLSNVEYQLFAAEDELPSPGPDLFTPADAADAERHPALAWAGQVIPVYPATSALSSPRIEQLIRTVLALLPFQEDAMPAGVRAAAGVCDWDTALRWVHLPETIEQAEAAQARIRWDEAFHVQLALARRRAYGARSVATRRPLRTDGLVDAFTANLPFTLSPGQEKVGLEISADLERPTPMQRLLHGEVGAGKTLVATRAMLQTVDAGGQAVLLAPTEVLAAQHAAGLVKMLGPLADVGDGPHPGRRTGHACRVVLLTGGMDKDEQKAARALIADGTAEIIVATHAILGKKVTFADLGLVVVDEQHRFGVEQRDKLRDHGALTPHLLAMTATPIPRTVAMTVYGDLDVSVLDAPPSGRKTVVSNVLPVADHPGWLERLWQRVREEVAAGRQAYVVCSRIGGDTTAAAEDDPWAAFTAEDQQTDAATPKGAEAAAEGPARPAPVGVEDLALDLATGALQGLTVGVLHGQLEQEQKDQRMALFSSGQMQVLVATTMVEVGVDVPNASVIVIMDADRFGVSQLHQLRGRVGRGGFEGLCVLHTTAPDGHPSRERLEQVAAIRDGFELARLDLVARKEGDILSGSQSGKNRFRLLDLSTDGPLIARARQAAEHVLASDPALRGHPLLAEALDRAVGGSAEFLTRS